MVVMRQISKWLRVSAALEIVVGLALLVYGFQDTSVLRSMWMMIGVTLLSFGLIMLVTAMFLGRLAPVEIRDPVAATARVLSVRDRQITVNHVQGMFEMRAEILHPDRAPYEATFTMSLGRTQWGAVGPGAIVPVLVERSDPMRIAVDPSRSVTVAGAAPSGSMQAPFGGAAPNAAAMPAGAAMPFGAPAAASPPVMSAADLIATGLAAFAAIEAVAPTGATAGQFVPGLAPHEADDPVVQVVLSFDGPSGPVRTHVAQRVPDGRAPFIVAGAVVPVRYSAADPQIATVDWSRI